MRELYNCEIKKQEGIYMEIILTLIMLVSFVMLALHRSSLTVWASLIGVWLLFLTLIQQFSLITTTVLWGVAAIVFGCLLIAPLRQQLFSKPLLKFYRRVMPKMSRTEKEALLAGSVSWDGDIFSGEMNWDKLFKIPEATLSTEEQAFLDGPVEILCQMIEDWDITHNRADLPPKMWAFLKKEGFFAMIIPKEYGGKGFSAYAHSQVITKVSSISATVSTTIAVPNSLGPAELLLHYGTKAQKDYYLPRLATGEEIPCFALTGPTAGSDAGGMPDKGIVCWGEWKGEKTLGIRLTWDKRYITLAPVATVLGLAFKLYDPEHLLGAKAELGITCALIPTTTPGVKIGRRHLPLNTVFHNGPTQGKDVFIPADWIIGGTEMAGHGWRMLMECLAAGRSISLPSTSMGAAKTAVAASTAYAKVRKQFKLPIAKFEGIQEVLARMSVNTLVMDAARHLTMAILDSGEKPSVISAIMKCYITEYGRFVGNDAMDLHGGKGICLGPKNYLGRSYQAIPISITVEGANILTRNMIIFGQGAIRCHPYTSKEMDAANEQDNKKALALFDKAIFGHMGYTISNIIATLTYGLTGAYIIRTPKNNLNRYCQQYSRMARAFAMLADLSMLIIGGALKRKESLSARFADIFSYLYLGSALIKYANTPNFPKEGMKIVTWALEDLLFKVQNTFTEILQNYPNKVIGKILSFIIFPFGKRFKQPKISDSLAIANIMTDSTLIREFIIQDAYLTDVPQNPVGRLQTLFHQVNGIVLVERHFLNAIKQGHISSTNYYDQLAEAVQKSILSTDEADELAKIHRGIKDIVAVDDFVPNELVREVKLVNDAETAV